MRTDAATGYVVTVVFMLAMVIIGTTMLYGTGTSISDEEGLVALSDPLGERFGVVAKWLFLIGFWSAVTSSILGAWNGAAYLFADFVRTVREVPDSEAESYLSEKSPYFRGFLVWITFPPMVLLFFGQPILLVIIYAALGAFFMPFLGATLLWLLNSGRVSREYRNRLVSNAIMVLALLVFAALAVQEIIGQF
jgi:Mn2+/Fe2+ NRAMP family transporter